MAPMKSIEPRRIGKRALAAMVIGIYAFASGSAVAADGPALAAEKGCTACHDTKARRLGPSFMMIAKRYSAKDKAKLVNRVLKGGAGSWGSVPMPSNLELGVNRADADKLVTWILKQK